MSEEIIKSIVEDDDIRGSVRHHHERVDGKGYPDGLKGDEIPLGARIIALADTFDAMTSERPYRMGFDRETALRIIKENAGMQFDPELADQFLQSIGLSGQAGRQGGVESSEGEAAT